MAWKDNLRPASFRGVPFFIDGSQFTTGRRLSNHEFPNRDTPYPEDLGKAGEVFRVDGHILGDEYFETKRRLIEAAQKFGPGELVHPYYGIKLVACGAFSIDEDTKEGGFAKISFQFYESGDNRFPRASDEKLVAMADKKASAITASKSAFDNVFSVAKSPAFVVDTARRGVNKVADLYTESTKGAVAVAEGVEELAYSTRNLKAEVNDLLQAPEKLSQRLIDSFALLEAALSLPEGRLNGMAKFFGYSTGLTAGLFNTINRQREQENTDAYDKFIRRVSVASAVNEAPGVEYTSADEALTARQELEDQIEDILLNSGDDDEVFNEFEDLKALLAELVPDADSDLPNVQTYEVRDTVPTLLVAYDLFENLDSEEDIIARNEISNPAFIPGGSTLEVIDVRKSS